VSTLTDSLDEKSYMGQAGEGQARERSPEMKLLAELERHSGTKTSEPRPVSRTRLLDRDDKQPSLRRRAARGVARVLIIFGMGVSSTLAWQSYGDALIAMIASSYPQLAWLAPQNAVHVEIPPAVVVTPTAAAIPSPDYSEQLKTGLAAVRESVNQIVATQQWMAGDIAKLQAGQRDILDKISSTSSPPSAAAPARKPTAAAPLR
jgi:hypothetical protein